MKGIYIQSLFLLITFCAFCQNNNCSNAIDITPSITCNNVTGNFNGSDITTSVPNCAAGSLQDVWYKFVANSATMNITLGTVNNINIAFEVLEQNCSGNSLACVNNAAISNGEVYSANNFNVGQLYYVRVFNNTGDISSASFTICVRYVPLGSNDFDRLVYTIYPNPVLNSINIESDEIIQDVSVYDMLGKKMDVNKLSLKSLDISRLSQGIYIIKITGDNGKSFSSRFIKE